MGTPQALADATGKVVWTMSQTPFGIVTVNEDPDGNGINVTDNFRFPGQYYDAETGLNYNDHRTYDPVIGRYTQSDPIGLFGGMNMYAYVGGNPISGSDPAGLDAFLFIPGNPGDPLPNSTPPSGLTNSGPVGNAWFGSGGGGAFGPIFGSSDSGVAFDTNGDVCFYSNVCSGVGANVPLSGELSPLILGAGTGKLCSGTTTTRGAYWFGGEGLGGEGNIQFSGDGNFSFSRGGFGIAGSPAGEAGGAGYMQCRLTLKCYQW